MLFNSYLFIFIFLPLALIGWYGMNHFKAYELSKLFLAAMSLWFYGYFNPYYPKSHSEKVNEFKSFMSEPMVCEALHKAKTTGIGIQRRLILCFIRLKMYRVLEILRFLRRKQLENK